MMVRRSLHSFGNLRTSLNEFDRVQQPQRAVRNATEDEGCQRGPGGVTQNTKNAWALPSTSAARPGVNDHLQHVFFYTPSNFP